MQCIIEFRSFEDFPTINPDIKAFLKKIKAKDKIVELDQLFLDEVVANNGGEPVLYSDIEDWLLDDQEKIKYSLGLIKESIYDYYDDDDDNGDRFDDEDDEF